MLENVRVANELGGLTIHDPATGADFYEPAGTKLHAVAMSGAFGQVVPYVQPPVPPVYASGAAALRALVAWIEAGTAAALAAYPQAERLAWGGKARAAEAWAAGTATMAETAILEAEAAVTGEAVADLAAAILEEAEGFRAASALLTGWRRRASAELSAEPDAYALADRLAGLQSDCAAAVEAAGLGRFFAAEVAVNG